MSDSQKQTELPQAPSQTDGQSNVIPLVEEEVVGDNERSVFPHCLLCVPVAIGMAWGFGELLYRNLFYFKRGARGDYGSIFIDLTFLHTPLLLVAMLFFAYWGCRFAREGGATKREMLRNGFLYMIGIFVVGLFIEWLLIIW